MNPLHHLCQPGNCEPNTKRLLNSKTTYIRALLSTLKQDSWDKLLDSLDHNDGLQTEKMST